MRQLLEIYRWVTLVAFIISGSMAMWPIIVFFIPGRLHTDIGVVGFLALLGTFGFSGFNVIAISIYDQICQVTYELQALRGESLERGSRAD